MKLIIPVSKSDRELIPNLYAAFDKFSFSTHHNLVVVGSHEVELDASDITAKLKPKFATALTHIIPDNNFGWPMACNHFWQNTCYYLNASGNNKPFLWFELDTTPIKDGWLDKIANDYHRDTTDAVYEKRSARKFLGNRERNYEGRNGELLPESVAGSRMSPVGVYPPEICKVPTLTSLTSTTRHWASVHQWYCVPALIDSDLIQNNWRTKNYRIENGKIVCDSVANLAWDVHFNNPINENAVLVHGCKDGSLLNLLLDNKQNDMKIVKQMSVEDAEEAAEEFEEKEETKKTTKKSPSFFQLFREKIKEQDDE
jgi:hypothetical protein